MRNFGDRQTDRLTDIWFL